MSGGINRVHQELCSLTIVQDWGSESSLVAHVNRVLAITLLGNTLEAVVDLTADLKVDIYVCLRVDISITVMCDASDTVGCDGRR